MVFAAANAIVLLVWLPWEIHNGPVDFTNYSAAASRVWSGGLYDWSPTYAYHYSPLFAVGFNAIVPLGIWGWRIIHVATALALPRYRWWVLASFPFWVDALEGNTVIFAVLLGMHALDGNRWAGWGFLGMTLLIPRPIMLPLAVWLLWREPAYRRGFAALVAAHTAVIAPWLADWVVALASSTKDYGSWANFSPSRLIGSWWMLIGVPLAGWLWCRGRIGLASLSISPYLLEPYWMMVTLGTTKEGRPCRPRSSCK